MSSAITPPLRHLDGLRRVLELQLGALAPVVWRGVFGNVNGPLQRRVDGRHVLGVVSRVQVYADFITGVVVNVEVYIARGRVSHVIGGRHEGAEIAGTGSCNRRTLRSQQVVFPFSDKTT